METFSALLALCAGSPVNSPAQRPVTRSFDVLFDLRLNKRLSKQSGRWSFETPSAHYDVTVMTKRLFTKNVFDSVWWRYNTESLLTLLGAVSIRKTVLPGMAIPMLKIRRPNGRLIFNMEIAIRR